MVNAEMTREKVRTLIGILENYIGYHEELVGLLERKKQAMARARLGELDDLNRAEAEAVAKISVIEADRIEALCDIGSALDHPDPARIRLRELIAYVESDQADELLEIRDRIRDLADRLDRLNRINRTLAVHSMDHIRLFVSMLSGVDPDAKLYSAGGKETGGPTTLIDRRA